VAQQQERNKMNVQLRNHPIIRMLSSRSIEEMTDSNGNHPFMLDLLGEKEMSDEDAKEMINDLIILFGLDKTERV